ncbi:semaphorin-4A isoform X2 [Solea solea]|uniref:semaphorin-4A isoform X2 n=1 Tax=Solea solea TaxID=90069 RepID=UPI00272BD331|nr:semaphorin-4A isoform X2 [Solea solea]
MAPSSSLVLLFLLCGRSSSGSFSVSLSPRLSFLLNSTQRPLVHFSLHEVTNTTTLLLSNDGSTLYVGARDTVLSLDVSQSDVIRLKRKVQWRPSEAEIKECSKKGKNEVLDCPNFVRVLQPINSTHLYACGSHAYSPRDAFIDSVSLSLVELSSGKGRCPFNPFQRNIAITIDSELFSATTADFRGAEPQISRHFSTGGRSDVCQDSSVSLLEEPTFIAAATDSSQNKLYFFFTEVGTEFSFVEKLRIARVAQVCKDDVGGQRTLQKKWTSFAKAPLLCQSHKQLPFNILQDVFTLPPPEGGAADTDTLFYGIFTSQSSRPESAVCVFKLQDVQAAFAGSYKKLDTQSHQWSPLLGKHSYLGKCGLGGASDSELEMVRMSFLTRGGVRALAPLLVSSEQSFSRVAAMRTTTVDGKHYSILFLLAESGFLHKVVLLDQGPRVVEEIQVFSEPQLVKNMVLSSSKGALYVGTSEGVTSVPVATCSAYRSCGQCVLAADPLCGWSLRGGACVRVDGSSDSVVQDVENRDVENKCAAQRGISAPPAEVSVLVNEVVELHCVKPSNFARLTWTSSLFKLLPQRLFIQSANGSLVFLAAAATTAGVYRCEAEEGGHKEVVVSYSVRAAASPRLLRPDDESNRGDEMYEDIATGKPPMRTPPSGDEEDGAEEFTVDLDRRRKANNLKELLRKDSQSQRETFEDTREDKSYYSELLAVSLLFFFCVCVLLLCGALYMWRHRKVEVKVDRLDVADTTKVVEC